MRAWRAAARPLPSCAQERTDAIAGKTGPGDFIAMVNSGGGYYILKAESALYELTEDTTLDELLGADGKPIQCSKGDYVLKATYWNPVEQAKKVHAIRGGR